MEWIVQVLSTRCSSHQVFLISKPIETPLSQIGAGFVDG